MNRGMKIISVIVCLVLVVFMALVMSRQHKEERAFRTEMELLQQQAQSYETEVNRIRSEVLREADETQFISDTGTVVISYYVKKADQLPSDAAAVMIDCEAEEDLVEALKTWNGEIFLLCNTLDTEQISALKAELTMDAFLLPSKYSSEENIAKIRDLGFTTFIGFADSYDNELRGDGVVTLCYVYVKSGEYSIANRLNAAVNERSVLLVIFDGELDDAVIQDDLRLINSQVEEDYLQYGTLASAAETVRNGDKLQEEKKAEYEQYEQEQQERISELEQKIKDIYAGYE